MVILPFSPGIGRADLLFFRRYAMTTLTGLYRGQQEDDHLEDDGPGHGHLGPSFLVFFAAYRFKGILVLEGIKAAA